MTKMIVDIKRGNCWDDDIKIVCSDFNDVDDDDG